MSRLPNLSSLGHTAPLKGFCITNLFMTILAIVVYLLARINDEGKPEKRQEQTPCNDHSCPRCPIWMGYSSSSCAFVAFWAGIYFNWVARKLLECYDICRILLDGSYWMIGEPFSLW
mmetsp:Transcript_17632/g.25739  ORF Transcript_17632/g.25739 Transcript_17632/m.25739 type:complete len:117 (+) Transcript_17632:217-567(+)